jgi:AcrR family transcriptional regulator
MPARVIVYCKHPVGAVTEAMLKGVLESADLMTLAEALDLPEGEEAAVEEMWKHLAIVGSESEFEITWHARQRPIQITIEPPDREEMRELLEELLPKKGGPGLRRVRAHLPETREVVAFELGIDGSHHLAATITEELAFFFSARTDGVVWFYGDEFAAHTDRSKSLWKRV